MEWIKCKERLPELKYTEIVKHAKLLKSDPVLAITDGSKTILIIYYLSALTDNCGIINEWHFNGGKALHQNAKVTHWMPLPELPKELIN